MKIIEASELKVGDLFIDNGSLCRMENSDRVIELWESHVTVKRIVGPTDTDIYIFPDGSYLLPIRFAVTLLVRDGKPV